MINPGNPMDQKLSRINLYTMYSLANSIHSLDNFSLSSFILVTSDIFCIISRIFSSSFNNSFNSVKLEIYQTVFYHLEEDLVMPTVAWAGGRNDTPITIYHHSKRMYKTLIQIIPQWSGP